MLSSLADGGIQRPIGLTIDNRRASVSDANVNIKLASGSLGDQMSQDLV
jgi:hypothetical protein